MLGLATVVRIPTLSQKLIEHHTFRQTQTAWTAQIYADQGIDLLHPKLPVVGPPFEIPFEFPAFQAVASIFLHAPLDRDVALRLAGLASFLVAGWLLWLLMRRLTSGRVALIALCLFTTTPLSLMFGRAVLIDYFALAASMAFAHAAIRWLDGRMAAWLVLAIGVGALAAAVKLPTFLAWPLFVLAYWWGQTSRGAIRSSVAGLGILIVLPLVAGLAWTAYADSIKAGSPITAGQTSAALMAWNFGTFAQRMDWRSWLAEGSMLAGLTIGLGWVPALLLARAGARRAGRSWSLVGLLGVGVVPPLLFFNLYVVHEYYWIAVSPGWAALLAVGVDELWRRRGRRSLPALGVATAVSLVASVFYWGVAYNEAPVGQSAFLDQAAEIDAHSAPDELVVVAEDSWMPTALYYAQRWGLAIPAEVQPEDILPTRALYSALSLRSPTTMRLDILSTWSWVAPVGRQTYRLGDAVTDLPADAVKWSPDQSNVALGDLVAGATEIECLGRASSVALPAAAGGLVVLLGGSASASSRLWVDADIAPLPPLGAIVIPDGLAAGISCDTGPVRVDGIYHLP